MGWKIWAFWDFHAPPCHLTEVAYSARVRRALCSSRVRKNVAGRRAVGQGIDLARRGGVEDLGVLGIPRTSLPPH